jgi:hypothetical protein
MFKTFNVNITNKIELESNKHFQTLMKDYNGIFAGGTAFAMFHGERMTNHLNNHSCSDLDLYFRSKEEYENAVEYAHDQMKEKDKYNVSVEKSITGLCHNFYTEAIKVQLVGCVFGTPEKIVTSFDFKNLELYYFWDNKALKYKCGSSKNASDTNYLNVRHTNSPFLMHRINKYISYRDFKGITVESRRHVTDWIIKASSGFYKENKDGCLNIYVDLLNNWGFINLLKNTDIVSDEDLVYMIGKIKQDKFECSSWVNSLGYTRETFSKVDSIDIVIQEMKKRELKNGS